MGGEPRFVPLRFTRLAEDEQLARSRAFLGQLRERRTVREFSSEPVPLELLENAIATAGTAPSGAHQQPWTFVLVSDPELKRRIREAAEEEERRSYENRMPDEWLEALRRLGTDWRKPHLEQAPHLSSSSSKPTELAPTVRRSSTTTFASLSGSPSASFWPASTGRPRDAHAYAEPDGVPQGAFRSS